MKKILLIFLILSPLCLLAQKKDSLIINIIPKIEGGDPIYVLDGKIISKVDVSKIKSDDVQEFSILKKPGSVELYGEKGKNGAVIINSKTTPVVIDSISAKAAMPLFIVDSVRLNKQQLNDIDPHNILEVTILKSAAAKADYGPDGTNGVALVITKKFAIKKYKEKFSTLSTDYKNYLIAQGNSDAGVTYIIDSNKIDNNTNGLYRLYSTSGKKIDRFKFEKNNSGPGTIVTITTKK